MGISIFFKYFNIFYNFSLQELGLIRKPASFMTSICDERGEELLYAGVPISRVLEQGLGIGGVLSLLWFQVNCCIYWLTTS